MTRTGSDANIAGRGLLLAIAYVLATGGLLAVLLVQLRAEALQAARKELSAFAQLIGGHTYEVTRDVEEALQLTTMTLAVATESGAADRGAIHAMLDDVTRNARILRDIVVLDSEGRVVNQSGSAEDVGSDLAAQSYFSRFKADPRLKFEVAPATRRRNDWSIPMAHAWRRSGGELAGVVVGFVDPQYFDKAWTLDSAIDGLAIALTAADGRVIVRQPFVDKSVGASLVDRPEQKLLEGDAPMGTLTAASAVDGRERLLAYRKVAGYPGLLVFASQPIEVVLSHWQRLALIIGASWLVLSLGLGVLGAWLAREIRTRGILQNRYRALFDSIPHPVIVSDEQFEHVLAFNDAAARQYGWTGRNAADPLRLPADFRLLAERRSQFSAEKASVIEGQRHRNGAGELIDADLTVRLIDYDRRPALLTIAVDVTDRKNAERARQAAEDQLRQSQKMEVLGQLTGGIAHDFNNILMVIQGNIESLLEGRHNDPDVLKQLAQMSQSAQRAEELTRQMLAFSRKQPLRPRPTNLNDLVVETGRLLRRTLGEQIEIDSVLDDDLWRVDVDRAQFELSLVNLCLNARDAMPDGGRVLIETKNVHLDGAEARRTGLSGDGVLLAVTDTGTGIPPENIDKIFEPFFTTKPAGRSSGLGLSMIYGFVRQSKGHIEVGSEPGHGASLRIYLPRCLEAAAAVRIVPTAVVGGAERVLVVEDDEQVRASVCRQLKSLGYSVAEAPDGDAGLVAFEQADPPYDLLLTDVIMPGTLNGRELADEVMRRWPQTRIVFMSGYTDNALGDRQVLLLSKPFRKSDLARMLRLAIEGEAAAPAAAYTATE